MNRSWTLAFLLPPFALAACLLLQSPQGVSAQPKADLPHATTPTPGRYVLEKDVWETPIMLDTATGEMWTLEESCNVVEARMIAWVPMTRLKSPAEVSVWKKEASEVYDSYFAEIQNSSRAELKRLRTELGPEHPRVDQLSKEINQLSNSAP